MTGRNSFKRMLPIFVGILLLSACKKDKVPVPVVEEPSKGEVIAGQYKVYDTLGTYLYDMNIVHIPNPATQYSDSLRFENFDGQFTFTQFQSNATIGNLPEYYFDIGVHNPVIDTAGNRWRIWSTTAPETGYNYLENDTIVLSFEKSNLQYYIEDLTPYFQCDCIQVAVKQ